MEERSQRFLKKNLKTQKTTKRFKTASSAGPFKKKMCKLCAEKIKEIDYKDIGRLQKSVTERGKIIPSRLSGFCATHQRMLSRAVKKARHIALLPYTTRY